MNTDVPSVRSTVQSNLDLYRSIRKLTASESASIVRAEFGRVNSESESELAEDLALVAAIETALAQERVTLDRFYFDWRGGALRTASTHYDGEDFAELRALLKGRTAVAAALDHRYWSEAEPCSMHIEEVEAIWAGIDRDDDWSALNDKVSAVRRMGEALRGRGEP